VNSDIQLHHIQMQDDPNLAALLTLYSSAFPSHERRDYVSLLNLLDNPDMFFMAVKQKKELAGFLIFWNFTDFRFIEHFAIFPEKRGACIGSQCLLQFIEMAHKPVYIEIEQPIDQISRRRIAFYQRHDFSVQNIFYAQPPYYENGPFIPMLLMSNLYSASIEAVEKAIFAIYENVYRCSFSEYRKMAKR
jgi:ribosomal protein S18 acetylase RimI-like enzyme